MLAKLNIMEVVHTSSVFVKLLCIVFVIPGYQTGSSTTDTSLLGTQNNNSVLVANEAETHYYTSADSNLNINSTSEKSATLTTTITEESTAVTANITTNPTSSPSLPTSPATVPPSYTTTTTNYSNTTTIVPSVTTTMSPPSENTTTNDPDTTAKTTVTPLTTTTSLPCESISIVNITSQRVLPTQVDLLLNLTGDLDCQQAFLNITCTPNDTWSWVSGVRHYSGSLNNLTYGLTLDDLSEFTYYTCVFEVAPEQHNSMYSFRTAEVVPSEPINLNATNITSSSFTLTWDTPIKVPTILNGYVITILRGNVSSRNHYWTGCSHESGGNYTWSTNTSYLHFDSASADFDYLVIVEPSSRAGAGNSSNITVSTLVAASEPPRKVTTISNEVVVGDKNIENGIALLWDMPCNTNGPVNYFFIQLTGYYSFNRSRADHNAFFVPIQSNVPSYSHNVTNLMASANYTLQIYAMGNSSRSLQGIPYNTKFTTSENYPSAPDEVNTTIQAHNFTLQWNKPTNNPGNITGYKVDMTFLGLEWERTNSCIIESKEFIGTINQWEREFIATKLIPGSSYNVAIAGETSRGVGNSTNVIITTNMDYPEILNVAWKIEDSPISGSQYNASALIEFIPGCFNGKFDHYYIAVMGSRRNYHDDYIHNKIGHSSSNDIQQYRFPLKPDYFYTVNVTVQNVNLNSTSYTSFTSPSGVPIFNENITRNIEPVAGQTQATITLRRNYFDYSQGDMRYLAIIISSENVTGGEFHRWNDNSQWPEPDADVETYYQATRRFWYPFIDADSVDFVIGNDTSCSAGTQFCNGPLEPGKTYFVFVRMFTGNYYRNSSPIKFVTSPVSRLAFILGLIFGLIGASTVGFIGLILWRKGMFKKIVSKEEPIPVTEISKEKFVEYCKYLEQNPDVLNKQWQDLEIKSVEIYDGLPHHFALLPENRRKNRFTNILPFDHTRVKLNMDEDDDISSDYINASYIKGFSTRNEYIATQGPLPHTVRDFWKMIFQENVSIIIMVARFIENKREKCYKYFPNNHETMLFGDDLEVRCSIELHFQIYCIRTLQVRRDDRQLTVTHVQFLEWPDFGVPEGTDTLLVFYQQIRDRWAAEGGMAVVHCSAGVGRTGTIIATDIIIRAMESGKKIDVFNTVLELRRQRKSMVQTEKQYMYIHQLVKSVIEDPMIDDDDSQEHVYQNVDLNTTFKNGLVESAF